MILLSFNDKTSFLKFHLSFALFLTIAIAMSNVRAGEQAATPVILLELYTSQGCYSCPPAESLLRDKYANRDDLMALEFHVDYWDDLVYGLSGSWEDPFSDNLYTQRQFAYNNNLLQRPSVFTPQMIIHGQHQSSGANKDYIDDFIRKQQQQQQETLTFYFNHDMSEGLDVRVEGAINNQLDFFYATYWLEKTTQIPSGENKGKILVSRNIVKKLAQSPQQRYLSLPPLDSQKEGCAVWLQKPSTGAILAAARCPTTTN